MTTKVSPTTSLGIVEEYLGDAVYASYDGFHIWLHTGDGQNMKIALDPTVFRNLLAYAQKVFPITIKVFHVKTNT